MIIDFSNLPEASKIWIFPSSRKFYEQELPELNSKITNFLNQWKNGENDIQTGFLLKYDRFIMVAADDTENSLALETQNELISFIQQLEKEYEVILLDKINVCFKQGKFVQYKTLPEFKRLISSKAVSKNTTVFNNMINLKEELDFDWEINIKDSWLGRLIK